ncbi:MAG: M20/M25/M40 family metallo-hydrolase [Anaerolineales bacterium]|nr:M20/M25/M40 family metallo-hydrolase [Anaerolineales bacterium]
MHNLFKSENLKDVRMDDLWNVYGRIEGFGNANPLIISAHLDTVFPRETDLEISRQPDRIIGPGIGDNSLGVAALFGLLWMLREQVFRPEGDIWLVANVGEEGLGDLRGMRAVVDHFGANVQAYLVIEGLALGYIYHRALGVERYRITIRTPGGHSWAEYGCPSAIHETARLITSLTSLHLPAKPRTSMNVGKILGGVAINVLAPETSFELDLRSEDASVLSRLVVQVEQLTAMVEREQVAVEIERIGQRPAGAIPALNPLVRLAKRTLRRHGYKPCLSIGSTDANIPLSLGYPAICLGVTRGNGAHTPKEFIYTDPVQTGMEQLFDFVVNIWNAL